MIKPHRQHRFPMPEEDRSLRHRINAYLASLTTLALATVDETGAPCAAAVYYAHDEHLNLYFLSARSTVHGRNLLAQPKVAGTVYAEHQEWKFLRGIQLKGVAVPVGLPAFHSAAALYNSKYSFISLVTKGVPVELFKAMAATTIWKLTPSWIRMTDNSKGFGFKEELFLAQEDG